MNRAELDKVLESDQSFAQYVIEHDGALDACTIELMHNAYELDGEDLGDEELLHVYAEILALHSHYILSKAGA
jgi:hypothetical protein